MFKILCSFADFEAAGATAVPEPITEATPTPQKADSLPAIAQGMTINVNIELQLPATEDEAIYDRLFAALRKHLLS